MKIHTLKLMSPPRAVLLLLCLLLAGSAVGAGPRLSLRLQNVTLHEALFRVRQETGWEVRGPSGEGAELFEMLPLKRDQPLRMPVVRSSIERLFATGRYLRELE